VRGRFAKEKKVDSSPEMSRAGGARMDSIYFGSSDEFVASVVG